MRTGQRSTTSDLVAALRAIYSEVGPHLNVAEDPLAVDLLAPPLSLLARALSSSALAAGVTHRVLSMATFGLSPGVALRTAKIDDVVRAAVDEGIEQMVVLGAGLDARAWRLPELGEAVVFELDFPATQQFKREHVRAIQPLAKEVRFCPIDFETDTIQEVLGAGGFDETVPSVWIWEGVTMYLTMPAIEATLNAISALATSKSRLVLTYVPPDYGPAWMQKLSVLFRAVGEELRGFMSSRDIERMLEARGFRLGSNETSPDIAARLWPPSEQKRVGDFERVADATKI